MPEHVDVRLPKLADTLVEGTVVRWLKGIGDAVARGEALVEIDTEKVSSTLESPAEGTLAEILVGDGELVPVDTVLARIAASGEATPREARPAPAPPPAVGGLSVMRRRIAERMQEARATIPQGACVREVDLSSAERRGWSWTALFVQAAARGMRVHDVGVAVEVSDGLIVPVARAADRLDLTALTAAIRDLVTRARAGTLQPQEASGAEVTVTNLGNVGTLMAFPLVPPGQPAIFAPGTIRDGRCYLTLCYDRRAYNDYEADRLLARVVDELERGAGQEIGATGGD